MTSSSPNFTIDLRRLRLLRELDDRGTLTATAAAMHLTTSAVSQQIAGLARDVGVPLLEHRGRGVRLTGQARVLLDHAAVVEQQVERARSDLAAWGEGTLGRVTVGALSSGISGFVAPLLRRLRQTRPGLQIRAVESEPPACFAALARGEVDIAIAIDYRDAPSRTDPRYHRVDLLADRMDVALPLDHPLAQRYLTRRAAEVPGNTDEGIDGIDLAALAGEQWVATGDDEPCAQIMFAVCAAAGFSPDVRHRSFEWAAVVALVAAGAGVALVPRLAAPVPLEGVVICPIREVTASRLVFAIARAGSEQNPAIAAVMDELVRIGAERRQTDPWSGAWSTSAGPSV